MEHIIIQMVKFIKDNGKMINQMVMESINLIIKVFIQATFIMEDHLDKEY
jgi:hypothetical protein